MRSLAIAIAALVLAASRLPAYELPELDPMPIPPAQQPLGSVTMGNPANFAEVKMDFPIENGPFAPTWSSIIANYPTRDSEWLRQAKFGIWVHFGPQAAGQSGDWYARRMYIEGQAAYNNHIRDYGHPSAAGYKDVIRTWNPTALNPAALTQAYSNAGARFLMIQGVHHDQYDNWNSKYQPWNSFNLGAKRDILGEWKAAVRAANMHFGVTFHHEYSWWWWQSCYRADTTSNQGKLGVPYDGNLTTNYNGAGQWWGAAPFDLRKLYLINLREYAGIYNAMDQSGWNLSQGIFSNHLDYAHWYATWWALRIQDVIENYDPDFIYTDGNSTQPFSGYKSGSGYKCDAMQRVLAHYFNRTLARRGTLDTFGIVKFNPYNRGVVNTYEASYPSAIKTDQPWIGEVPVGDWFYNTGFNYSPGMVVRYLLECVSRDGAAAINIALRPDGSLDPGSVTQLQGVGAWMNINSAGIYGSRAWLKYGEGTNVLPTGALGNSQANKVFTTSDFRYTVGADGFLYAYCMTVPAAGAQLKLTALGTGDGNWAAPITSVQLLGSAGSVTWSQTATDLNITCPASMPFQIGVGFKIGPPAIVRPSAPTDLFAQSSPSGVALRWSSPMISASFTVKRATDPSGPFTTIASGITAQTFTDTTLQAGSLYYYTVAAVLNGTTSPDSAAAPGILAAAPGWRSQDIGDVGASGGFEMSGDRAILSGSGSDIWGTADEFRFAYLSLNGAGSITARVASSQDTAPWAKAGLMIRESLDANSKHAIAFITPSNGTALQQRASTGGSGGSTATSSAIRAPYWLRLARSGNTFTASQSADGASWTTIGSTTITMSANVYIGLAVCSVNDGRLLQAAFDHIAVTGQIMPQLLSAVSRKTHGTAGVFDIPISVSSSGATGLECRTGSDLVLVAAFDQPVVSGSAALASGTATVKNIAFSGNTATVTLANVANAQTLQVNLGNVTAQNGMVLANGVLRLKVLAGDVNGNSAVNALDAALVSKASGKAVDAATFRCDVNANGSVNSLDSALASQRSGTSAP
jgi:alpha-L-fucosidase